MIRFFNLLKLIAALLILILSAGLPLAFKFPFGHPLISSATLLIFVLAAGVVFAVIGKAAVIVRGLVGRRLQAWHPRKEIEIRMGPIGKLDLFEDRESDDREKLSNSLGRFR